MANRKNRAARAQAPAPAPQPLLMLTGPQAPAPQAPATPANVTPTRGAATRARWGACLKGVAGATVLLGAQVKALPLTTIITCNVAQNPKRGASGPAFAAYGFATGATVGATTTLGAYVTALHKAMAQGATQACAHVAWDVNHGYITLTQAAVTQTQAA